MDVKPGALIDGRYHVERVLASDDSGILVSTREAQNGLLVAVKVFPASIPESRVIGRFRRAQHIESPYVPKLFELGGLDDGRTFIAMEHLNGTPLSERVARGPLAIGDAVLVMTQASLAVAAAHRAGVVHRRLSTSKLLETKAVADALTVRVLGFATTLPSYAPEPGELPADLDFLAPEQLAGIQHGERSADIWALGIIFYQLLTGRLPFTGMTRKAVGKQISGEDPKPPRSFRPDAPWQLEQSILRCLDKNPSGRMSSAEELASLLESFAISPTKEPSRSAPPHRANASLPPPPTMAVKTPTDLPHVAKLRHVLSGGTANTPVEQTKAAFHRLRGDGQIEGVKIEDVVGMAHAKRIDSQSAELKARTGDRVSIPPSSAALSIGPRRSNAPGGKVETLSAGNIVGILIGSAVILGLMIGLLLHALLR